MVNRGKVALMELSLCRMKNVHSKMISRNSQGLRINFFIIGKLGWTRRPCINTDKQEDYSINSW